MTVATARKQKRQVESERPKSRDMLEALYKKVGIGAVAAAAAYVWPKKPAPRREHQKADRKR